MRRSTSCARKDACERHAPAAYAGGARLRAVAPRPGNIRAETSRHQYPAPAAPRSTATAHWSAPQPDIVALQRHPIRRRRAKRPAPHPGNVCTAPAPQFEVFGNNLRLLQRLRPLFPSAAMRPIDANRLNRYFARRPLGKRCDSVLFRPQEAHSTEIMVENLEFNCKFDNYLRLLLQGCRTATPRARRRCE